MNKDNKESVQIAVEKAKKELKRKLDHEYYLEMQKIDCTDIIQLKAFSQIVWDYFHNGEKHIAVIDDLETKLFESIKLQADRIKKLDEDWKELDSDCMILHDKNKQLEAENKELKELKNWAIKAVYPELVRKTDILDKVKGIIMEFVTDKENEICEYCENAGGYCDLKNCIKKQLIKEIDKLKGV
jgi:hypothetical protein